MTDGLANFEGNGDGFIEDAGDPWEEAWEPHMHDSDELIEGQELPPHIHTPDSTFSVALSLPLFLRHNDDASVVELAEFRGVVMTMAKSLEAFREEADLRELPLAQAQFRIIAYNMDRGLAQALIITVDKALAELGMNPPCQLQPVESSNVRSMGFVRTAASDELPVEARLGYLYVAFTRGGLYQYSNVPESIMQELIDAESVGAAFAQLIKSADYEFVQVA